MPKISASRVATAATRRDRPNASQKSVRLNVVLNQSRVNPGGGNVKDASSVVKAHNIITRIGKCRKISAAPAAIFSHKDALLDCSIRLLERIKRP